MHDSRLVSINPRPETSIVITCYNYGRYLRGCLQSVVEQTYTDYEIIVIDDGSTDDTPQIMQGLAGQPNLRYVRQENGGQARAKNHGLQLSRGRYVAFLDADDLWEKDKLEKQIPLFSNPAVGVVYGRANLIDDNGAPIDLGLLGGNLTPRAGRVSRWLFINNFIWFSSSVSRRECLERFSGFDESLPMGIDWDLWLRISAQYDFDFVDEPLIRYRVGHPGQMSKNLEVRQQCSDRIMERFLRMHPGLVDGSSIREAFFSSFCNRGEYYRHKNKWISYYFFIRAIYTMPFRKDAYKGIIKNLINCNHH